MTKNWIESRTDKIILLNETKYTVHDPRVYFKIVVE